jgi:isoleucyl-tRNA synthetase
MEVRGEVLKSLESARNAKLIGAPLEAHVHLSADGELYSLLERYGRELPALFIVSQVSLARGGPELAVHVERASGAKCERCWKYTEDTGSNAAYPTICAACASAVEEMRNA